MVIILTLNGEIERILLDNGAIKVGFLTKDTLAGGPPSSDITYSMPEAQSAVSYAMPLDREKIRAFLRKDLPNGRVEHEIDNIMTYLRIYRAGNLVVRMLKEKGHKARVFFPNFKKRKDVKASLIRMFPFISLRYLAVRSGVGSYGWSGNIGVKGHGTVIILGGLVTSAKLEPTDPLPPEETFCNSCKMCVRACPMRMFDDEIEESITLGGNTFHFSQRNHLFRCFAGCGGFSGLDQSDKWSSWSPGRYQFPRSTEEVIDVLAKSVRFNRNWRVPGERPGYDISNLQADSEVTDSEYKELYKGNKHVLKEVKNTTLTCGNCQLICWGDPKETAENYRILTQSGCVVRNKDGSIEVLPPDQAEKKFEEVGGNKRSISSRIISWVAKIYLRRVQKYFERKGGEDI